ncbi:MAG: hypothetical protein K2H16_05580 [Prevotella sp.]|nr:hypothetical protein [Prevotella sp.]
MELLFTILIGMVIGAIDALPMFLKKMDKANCWSAFLQYVVVTFIIFNTTLPQLTVSDFVAGPLISFMMALPMVVMIAKSEKKAVPVILVNAVVLGLIIAVIKHYSIHLFL